MFEIQIGSTNIGVKFSHSNDNWLSSGRRLTACFVITPNKTHIGNAFCSHNDQYNKNTGRKIALARAIKTAPRSVRKLIWDAYFETRGHVD